MRQTRWYFGYVCDLILGEHGWFGVVTAPRWHPVRVAGLSGYDVFLMGGVWCVLLDGGKTYVQAVNECRVVAVLLGRMQKKWDALSPYEREYVV